MQLLIVLFTIVLQLVYGAAELQQKRTIKDAVTALRATLMDMKLVQVSHTNSAEPEQEVTL